VSSSEKNVGRGLTLGLLAYFLWGSFPLIIKFLGFATPWEIVVWRIVFGLIAGFVFILVARSMKRFVEESKKPQVRKWVALSTVVIMINWTVYVYAVSTDHVVEASLGYFINPLVTILLAIGFLGERLRKMQWVALGFGLVAGIILTIDYGRLPWIALSLAGSFGLYSLAKNRMAPHITALHSYTLETLLLTPIALGMLFWVAQNGPVTFVTRGWLDATGLAMYGVLTAVPLILFGLPPSIYR